MAFMAVSPKKFGAINMALAVVSVFAGEIACVNAAGYATKGSIATGLRAIGVFGETKDNSGGSAGDLEAAVFLSQGKDGPVVAYPLDNDGGDPCDQSCVGKSVYIAGANSVSKTDGGATQSRAGKCWMLSADASKVYVEFDRDEDIEGIDALDVRVTAAEATLAGLVAAESLWTDEFTNAAAAGAATLKTATATIAAPTTYTQGGGDFPVAGGITALNSIARRLRITVAGVTPSDAPASGVWSGTDINGDPITETVTIPQTATSVDTVGFYTGTGLQIVLAAADGTGATLAFGFTAELGLTKEIKIRAGLPAIVNPEIADGAYATNGTWDDPTSSAPNGSYSPNSAPNGSRDYSVKYERVL